MHSETVRLTRLTVVVLVAVSSHKYSPVSATLTFLRITDQFTLLMDGWSNCTRSVNMSVVVVRTSMLKEVEVTIT